MIVRRRYEPFVGLGSDRTELETDLTHIYQTVLGASFTIQQKRMPI